MTRLIQVANNATTTLASGITAIATSLTVAPGTGAKFPALSGSQYFKATLVKATGEIEVVKVTAKATDTFTIVRANEVVAGASTAYAFSAGDKVECRWTGNSITDELDRLDAAALNSVANKTANYTVLASDISNLLRVDTTAGAITITLPQISTLTDDFAVLVSKVTSDGNAVTIARSSTNTINGATSYALTSQWQSAWLIADRSTNTWTAINSSTGSISAVVDTFAGSGTAGPFTLSVDPGSVNNLAVFVGGVYQEKATLTLAGTSLTLGGTVASGTNVQATYNTPVGIGVPGDGTVTIAKLARAPRIDVASVAGTVDLTTSAPNTDDIRITGALAITKFTVAAGRVIRFTAGGAFSFANNANIVTQTGATLTFVAGETGMLRATANDVVEVLCLSERPVMFRAYATGATTVPSATVTGIALSTESYDIGSCFAASTFTAPFSGYFEFDGQVEWDSLGGSMWAGLLKNGAEVSRGTRLTFGTGAGTWTCPVSDQIYLAAGDTVNLSASQNSGTSISVAGSINTRFYGKLIARA